MHPIRDRMMKVEGSEMGEKRKVVQGRRIDERERIVRRRGGGGVGRPQRLRLVLAGTPSSAIQRLFEVCMAVFKGPGKVSLPKDVQMLQLVLGEEENSKH